MDTVCSVDFSHSDVLLVVLFIVILQVSTVELSAVELLVDMVALLNVELQVSEVVFKQTGNSMITLCVFVNVAAVLLVQVTKYFL